MTGPSDEVREPDDLGEVLARVGKSSEPLALGPTHCSRCGGEQDVVFLDRAHQGDYRCRVCGHVEEKRDHRAQDDGYLGPNVLPRPRHPASDLPGRHVHVGVDVSSQPLWEGGANVGTESYALSRELADALDRWADEYNEFWDQWGDMAATLDTRQRFDQQGLSLAATLARELGEGFVVHFDSIVRGESEVVFRGGSAEEIPRDLR